MDFTIQSIVQGVTEKLLFNLVDKIAKKEVCRSVFL